MLPSVLTVGNLFLGVLAVILVMQGHLEYAVLMIIIGMLLDGLDGRVARWLNAQSEFGKELDSLSDIVTFGVAPAIVMYSTLLHSYGALGIFIAAAFPICGALRLARFSVQEGVEGYFVGLPITAAGGILATLALYNGVVMPSLLLLGMIGLSYLMVSNLKYPSFKTLGFPRYLYTVSAILIIAIIIISFIHPGHASKMLFLPLALYALYGLRKRKKRPYRRWSLRRRKKNYTIDE